MIHHGHDVRRGALGSRNLDDAVGSLSPICRPAEPTAVRQPGDDPSIHVGAAHHQPSRPTIVTDPATAAATRIERRATGPTTTATTTATANPNIGVRDAPSCATVDGISAASAPADRTHRPRNAAIAATASTTRTGNAVNTARDTIDRPPPDVVTATPTIAATAAASASRRRRAARERSPPSPNPNSHCSVVASGSTIGSPDSSGRSNQSERWVARLGL